MSPWAHCQGCVFPSPGALETLTLAQRKSALPCLGLLRFRSFIVRHSQKFTYALEKYCCFAKYMHTKGKQETKLFLVSYLCLETTFFAFSNREKKNEKRLSEQILIQNRSMLNESKSRACQFVPKYLVNILGLVARMVFGETTVFQ